MQGPGADRVVNHEGGRINGAIRMGPDADVVILKGSYQGLFGGGEAVIDGGIGIDRFERPDYSFDQITGVAPRREGIVLSLDNGPGALGIELRNWERFSFAGVFYTAQQIEALASKQMSLTGVIVIACGLAGLGLLGGRRRVRIGIRSARRASLRLIASFQSVSRTSA